MEAVAGSPQPFHRIPDSTHHGQRFRLTGLSKYAILNGMSPRSTPEVAKLTGIHLRTLERWIKEGRVSPGTVVIGQRTYRLWTDAEIKKLRRVKEKTYRKGRGRKPKR